MFSPSRLTVARHRRGWKKTELAKRTGLSTRTLSAYENGDHEPEADSVAVLARILGFPLEFFSLEELDEPPPISASFRSLARMAAWQRDAALAAGAIAGEVCDWLERRFVLPEPNLPDLRGADPEIAAMSIRQAWVLGEKPIRNMIHLAERYGVRIFSLAEQSREVDAFSTWRGQTPFIFVNSEKSPEHSRFDVAHELGHLVLHRHGAPQGRQAEKEANVFASALLMPAATLLAESPRLPSWSQMMELKRVWRVSLAALVHRLHSIHVLSDWRYRSLCVELSKRGYRTQEPEGLEIRESSQVLAKTLEELRQDGVTHRDLAATLRLPMRELNSLLFGLVVASIEGEGLRTQRRVGHLRIVESS